MWHALGSLPVTRECPAQVNFEQMQIQKQIGEGSFGKVYLAKWKETTVAVKILSSSTSSSDDDFPTRLPNPLLQSLEKVCTFYAFGLLAFTCVTQDLSSCGARIRCLFHRTSSITVSSLIVLRLVRPTASLRGETALLQEASMMAAMRHPNVVLYLGVCLDPPCVVTEYCARGSLNDVLKRALHNPKYAEQLDWRVRCTARTFCCSSCGCLCKPDTPLDLLAEQKLCEGTGPHPNVVRTLILAYLYAG